MPEDPGELLFSFVIEDYRKDAPSSTEAKTLMKFCTLFAILSFVIGGLGVLVFNNQTVLELWQGLTATSFFFLIAVGISYLFNNFVLWKTMKLKVYVMGMEFKGKGGVGYNIFLGFETIPSISQDTGILKGPVLIVQRRRKKPLYLPSTEYDEDIMAAWEEYQTEEEDSFD